MTRAARGLTSSARHSNSMKPSIPAKGHIYILSKVALRPLERLEVSPCTQPSTARRETFHMHYATRSLNVNQSLWTIRNGIPVEDPINILLKNAARPCSMGERSYAEYAARPLRLNGASPGIPSSIPKTGNSNVLLTSAIRPSNGVRDSRRTEKSTSRAQYSSVTLDHAPRVSNTKVPSLSISRAIKPFITSSQLVRQRDYYGAALSPKIRRRRHSAFELIDRDGAFSKEHYLGIFL